MTDKKEELPKKKRKNPWHKRRINKRYAELKKIIDDDPDCFSAKKDFNDKLTNYNKSIDIMNSAICSYKEQIKGTPKVEELIDGMSIKNLNDLYLVESGGRPASFQYRDLNKIYELRYEAAKFSEDSEKGMINMRISGIELLEKQIAALLKNIDK